MAVRQITEYLKKNWYVIALALVLIYALSMGIVDRRLQSYEQTVSAQISEQKTLLATIAEAMARGGADSVTESIVRDCTLSERASFDNLLGKLNDGLSYSQLVELERLFGRCGSFYSERKSVMVARFAREIGVYETYVKQLGAVEGQDLSDKYGVTDWLALATEEQKQNELFSELVQLQEKIINTLIEGYSATSPEITEILDQVKETQGLLVVASQQASNIRSGLVAL